MKLESMSGREKVESIQNELIDIRRDVKALKDQGRLLKR